MGELAALVATAGMGIDEGEAAADSLTVVRGAKGAYCFTLSEAQPVEAEDVPEEVTEALLEPAFLYELLVEGSSSTEIPHAVKFARRLAAEVEGAVLDQQTGMVLSRGKLRTPEPVEQGRISTIEVRWYVRFGFDAEEMARTWLRLVRKHLPEALPRRYGVVEPLRGKLDEGGDEAFIEFVGSADGTVFFAAKAPVADGSLAPLSEYGRAYGWHSLTLLAPTVAENPLWRAAVRRLFVEFARESSAIVATAEVLRGAQWSGRSLGFDSMAEYSPALWTRAGTWAGLPPYPVWMCWFGPEYAPLVAEHLDAARTEQVGEALLFTASDEPKNRDELAPTAPNVEAKGLIGRLFRRREQPVWASAWLPDELLLTIDDSDARVWNKPPLEAKRRPSSLA